MKLILNNYYTTIIDPHVLLEGCCGIKHMNIFTCNLRSKGKQLDKRKGKSLRQTAKLQYLVPQNKTISIITPLTNILPPVKTHTCILLSKLNYISVIYIFNLFRRMSNKIENIKFVRAKKFHKKIWRVFSL